MIPPRAAAVLLLALCVTLGAVACEGPEHPGPTAPAASRPAPSGPPGDLVVSGNELGFIRPCGCSKPAIGGIDRRAAALAALREHAPGLPALSLGNLVARGGKQQRWKFETFLAALEEMEYRALCLGEKDFLLGLEYLLTEARAMTSVPFACLNLQRGGQTLFEPWVRVAEPALLVTGVLDPALAVPGASVQPLEQVLPGILKALRPGETLLLTTARGEQAAREIADAVPPAWRDRARVLFGGGFDEPARVTPQSGVALASVGSKGRHLASFALFGLEVRSMTTLGDALPRDEAVADMLGGYRQMLREERLIEALPRQRPPAPYVGRAACAECHEDVCGELASSAHARAFDTLVRTGDQFDPECAQCHVTGWGQEGGFVSAERTPQRLHVTCEACHGPGGRHVETQEPTPGGALQPSMCIRCHDPDNSPRFRFEDWWPKIRHPR